MAEVTSDGLATMVQPEARMKGTRSQRIRNGKFHGVISPTTPIGSRVTRPNILSPEIVEAVAVERASDPGGIAEDRDAAPHLAARLGDRLAVFQRLPIGDLFGAGVENVGGLEQDGGAVGPGQTRPAAILEGRAGGGDGGVEIVGRAFRDACHRSSMARRIAHEDLAVACGDVGAIDEEAEVARGFRRRKPGR